LKWWDWSWVCPQEGGRPQGCAVAWWQLCPCFIWQNPHQRGDKMFRCPPNLRRARAGGPSRAQQEGRYWGIWSSLRNSVLKDGCCHQLFFTETGFKSCFNLTLTMEIKEEITFKNTKQLIRLLI